MAEGSQFKCIFCLIWTFNETFITKIPLCFQQSCFVLDYLIKTIKYKVSCWLRGICSVELAHYRLLIYHVRLEHCISSVEELTSINLILQSLSRCSHRAL